MAYYNFYKDLKVANKTEQEIADYFERGGFNVLEMNNDNRYDLLFENELTGLQYTGEIKEDFTCKKTGNVGVEYSCRNKPSGINVSQADFYLYKIHTPKDGIEYNMMKTKDLKRIISEKKYHRTVNGGDPGSNSLCYLFYLNDIRNISKVLPI